MAALVFGTALRQDWGSFNWSVVQAGSGRTPSVHTARWKLERRQNAIPKRSFEAAPGHPRDADDLRRPLQCASGRASQERVCGGYPLSVRVPVGRCVRCLKRTVVLAREPIWRRAKRQSDSAPKIRLPLPHGSVPFTETLRDHPSVEMAFNTHRITKSNAPLFAHICPCALEISSAGDRSGLACLRNRETQQTEEVNATDSVSPDASTTVVEVTMTDHAYEPSRITVPAG